ncbi:MAG: hypothetical protein ACI9CF_000449 [Candidatus Omnitrophota bacterium]|jgi:hypothetical protein
MEPTVKGDFARTTSLVTSAVHKHALPWSCVHRRLLRAPQDDVFACVNGRAV